MDLEKELKKMGAILIGREKRYSYVEIFERIMYGRRTWLSLSDYKEQNEARNKDFWQV